MAPAEREVPDEQKSVDAADIPVVGTKKVKSANLAPIDTSATTGGGSIDSEMPSSADTVVDSSQDAAEDKLASNDHARNNTATTGGTDAKPEDASDAAALDARPSKASEPASRTISYHQNADLCIRIRDKAGTTHNLKVCASLLVAALPILGDLSACANAAGSGDRILDLDGFQNNYQGLDTILSIIHYKFHEIPARPDIELLYHIAQVVEKYDCAHLVLPYMEKW